MDKFPKLPFTAARWGSSATANGHSGSDGGNSSSQHGDSEQDPEKHIQLQSGSTESLVDAALKLEGAGGRHCDFRQQLTDSVGVIQGLIEGQRLSQRLRQRRGSQESATLQGSGSGYGERSEEEEQHNGDTHAVRCGNVLGSLLQMQAQLANATPMHKAVKRDRGGTPLSELKEVPTNRSTPADLSKRRGLSDITRSEHIVPSLRKQRKKRAGSSREDSLSSGASQFEPLSAADRVRIAFEIANILQRQSFLYRLAKALMKYGCPAHRIEYVLKHVSQVLNLDAEIIYMPNIMLINFFDPDTHTTETHFIRGMQAFNMHRLGEVYRLEKLVVHGEVTIDEALSFLDQVENDPQYYPTWMNPIVYAILSLSGCVMFFGGRWREAALSAGLAMFFAIYELFSDQFWGFKPIWEITVCIIIGFVSRASTRWGFCFIPTAFSSFIVLLPGYVLANAVIELISRQLVSGVARLVYAIIYSFLLGYGVSMGSSLYITIDRHTSIEPAPYCQAAANATTCISAESQFYHFLTVPLFALGNCILLRNRPKRWPVVIIVSIIGFCINWVFSCVINAPEQVIQVVPAFVVGLVGNLLTKLTATVSFDAVLVAIYYLVPGSLGLKAAIGLFGGQQNEYMSQGGTFALSMIEASIGIALGLGIANLVVYPKGAQHTPLMNI